MNILIVYEVKKINAAVKEMCVCVYIYIYIYIYIGFLFFSVRLLAQHSASVMSHAVFRGSLTVDERS